MSRKNNIIFTKKEDLRAILKDIIKEHENDKKILEKKKFGWEEFWEFIFISISVLFISIITISTIIEAFGGILDKNEIFYYDVFGVIIISTIILALVISVSKLYLYKYYNDLNKIKIHFCGFILFLLSVIGIITLDNFNKEIIENNEKIDSILKK